jgi:4-hydroxy-tetrahydrodipicolinate synthase
VYNVPGRTASNIEAETMLALAEHPNIVALKEASGNLTQITEIIRHRPATLSVLSGDDGLTLGVIAGGGHGVVSVISNAVPRLTAQLCDAASRGEVATARAIHLRLHAFTQAAFSESNPIPIKAALAMMGRIQNQLRLPLVPLATQHVARVRAGLLEAGVVLA